MMTLQMGGDVGPGYRDISVEGVARTTDALRLASQGKAKAAQD